MQRKPLIVAVWTAALLVSAVAVAEPSAQAIRLIRPAASAAEAVDSVAAALRGGDSEGAERLADLALDRHDLSREEHLRLLLNRALAREQLGKREEALGDFSAALDDSVLPRAARARALFDRGVVLDELGEPDKAIADYSAALKYQPHFPAALNNRANAYRRLGRLAQARRDYEASLAAGNTEPQYANYGLGQIAEAQGNPLAAQDYYRKALTADPHYRLATERLAALGETLPQASFVLHRPAPKPVRETEEAPPRPPRVRLHRVSYGSQDGIPELRPAILGPSAGSGRIQLGAYRAETDAAQGWNMLIGEAKGLLGGLTPQIVAVDLPGRGRFFRLRAGPLDHDEADTLCARLKARGLACMPVNG